MDNFKTFALNSQVEHPCHWFYFDKHERQYNSNVESVSKEIMSYQILEMAHYLS